jgi:hypothetical protein
MKRKVLALIVIVSFLISLVPVVAAPSFSSSTPSVPPAMEWDARYGSISGLSASQAIQTSDGGYAIAGNVVVHSYIKSQPPYVWFVKADATGKMEWNQSYEDLYDIVGLVQTRDGGYVTAGNCYTMDLEWNIHPEGIRLFKTDSNGKVQWSQTYTSWSGSASSMVQTNDGGYAIAGKTGNSGFLIKTDASGRTQWNETYREPDKDNSFSSVIQTGDGGYAAAGTTNFNGSDASWLVKTGAGGNVVWNQTYKSKLGTNDTTFDNYANSVIQTDDGGYALAANQRIFRARGESSEVWLVKTDSLGDMVWNQTFGDYHSVSDSLIQTSDGGLAFAGNTPESAWIVKLDATGNEEWNQTYPKTHYGIVSACCLIETSDGAFALAGSWDFSSSDNYYFLVKTEPTLPPPTPAPTPPSSRATPTDFIEVAVIVIVAIVVVILVGVGLLLYFKKRRH